MTSRPHCAPRAGQSPQAEPASDCLASPLRPGVKQAFTFGCNAGRTGGRIACPHGKSKRRRSIAARSRVSGRHCPQFSQPACSAGRSPGHSFRRRRGSPSTPSGALIRFARIVSRVRWRREAASRTDGRGNSARRRAECPRHFVSRPRPIEKRPLHAAPASAACADSVSITSAGMSTCGAKARTSAPPGMVHASSLGSSGMRRANRRPCCDDFRHAAAGRRAAASGRTRKSIIACRFIASGTSIGVYPGRTCSIIGVCRTCRSSIATRMF